MWLRKTSDIRIYFGKKLMAEDFVTDKSGVKTIEIVNASFVADEPFIFGQPNEDYIKRELEWYESQSLYVADIPGNTPKIWQHVADNEGKINSNYGWCIFSDDNYAQYQNVLATLAEEPNSRQAVMIYTRPSMHNDAHDGGMSDFMCTNAVQYLIRGDELITMVNMRSNDVIFGYNNDFAWQKYVRDKLIEDLETDTYIRYKPGPIHWNVGSLHLYERHFSHVAEYLNAVCKDIKYPFVVEEKDKDKVV